MLNSVKYNVLYSFELATMEKGEQLYNSIVANFSSKNPDVELFLKQKAFHSTKLKTSSTYLIVNDLISEICLYGYFTLALKMLTVKKDSLTLTNYKLLKQFGYEDLDSKSLKLPAILIAQFGKNFNVKSEFSGTNLMDIAIEKVKDIFNHSSGKLAFLECEQESKIISFYESQGFRILDKTVAKDGSELLQMYRII